MASSRNKDGGDVEIKSNIGRIIREKEWTAD